MTIHAELERQGWTDWGGGLWAIDCPATPALLAVERFDGRPVAERRWDLYEDQGDTEGAWRWGRSLGIVDNAGLLARAGLP